MITYPAVQVLSPGPLTTHHRTTEGVREAALVAADYLRTDPGSLTLVDLTVTTKHVIHTFTTRPRDAG